MWNYIEYVYGITWMVECSAMCELSYEYLIQICSGITRGRVLNVEINAHRFNCLWTSCVCSEELQYFYVVVVYINSVKLTLDIVYMWKYVAEWPFVLVAFYNIIFVTPWAMLVKLIIVLGKMYLPQKQLIANNSSKIHLLCLVTFMFGLIYGNKGTVVWMITSCWHFSWHFLYFCKGYVP